MITMIIKSLAGLPMDSIILFFIGIVLLTWLANREQSFFSLEYLSTIASAFSVFAPFMMIKCGGDDGIKAFALATILYFIGLSGNIYVTFCANKIKITSLIKLSGGVFLGLSAYSGFFVLGQKCPLRLALMYFMGFMILTSALLCDITNNSDKTNRQEEMLDGFSPNEVYLLKYTVTILLSMSGFINVMNDFWKS